MDWSEVRLKLEQYYWWILAGVAGIWLISQWGRIPNWEQTQDYDFNHQVASPAAEVATKLWADIGGAVNQPGVYSLPPDSRVADLVSAAGGFSSQADLQWVEQHLNRAAPVRDGMKLYIPAQGEQAPVLGSETSAGLVSINQASQAELEALWGIGKVTARRIIDHRPYNRVEDLIDQKIITPQAWEENKDKLTL